jgi:hypothetical protein
MAANPQMVTANTTATYDGVIVPLMRGTVIDVPNGSALATALSGKIVALSAQQQIPGSSDSLGAGSMAAGMENGYGPGKVPYNAGQAG